MKKINLTINGQAKQVVVDENMVLLRDHLHLTVATPHLIQEAFALAGAMECAMDLLVQKLDMDPLAFRKLNSLAPGLSKATGHLVDQ